MHQHPICFSTALLCCVASSFARGDILYTQLGQGVGAGFGVVSNDQRHPLDDAFDAQAADDFVVPSNTTWRLTDIIVEGQHQDEVIGVERAHVFIYSDLAGVPGDLLYSNLDAAVTSTSTSNFSVPLSTDLDAGTYWVSVQTAWPEYQDWIWSRREPATGHNGVWRNPADGFAYGHTEWTELPDLSFLNNAPTSSDLVFEIRGSVAAVPEPSGFSLLGAMFCFHWRRRSDIRR